MQLNEEEKELNVVACGLNCTCKIWLQFIHLDKYLLNCDTPTSDIFILLVAKQVFLCSWTNT